MSYLYIEYIYIYKKKIIIYDNKMKTEQIKKYFLLYNLYKGYYWKFESKCINIYFIY